jgi:outer membrane protein assembly factor BamB/tetratricopeptide (TPR) repeat protein
MTEARFPRPGVRALAALSLLLVASAARSEDAPVIPKAPKTALDRLYERYRPDFLGRGHPRDALVQPAPAARMRVSTEPSFYSQCYIELSDRADALVRAGMTAEAERRHRQALEIYQQVIDKFPEALYRMSGHGIYVPAAQYCQLRILAFPRQDLQFYRDKHEARARELFETYSRRYSREGLAFIRDRLLCTMHGARAVLTLGDAELDRGHYLAALEYYSIVKTHFPDEKLRTAELAMKTAYARKMLGDKVVLNPPKPTKGDLLKPAALRACHDFVQKSVPEKHEFFEQRHSESCITADDYMHMLPTEDPLGIREPVWSVGKGGGGLTVDTQPVVTERSVIYRHLNIVYCRSILNGELRWRCDLGGRVSWESRYKNHKEDLLVQDGTVFTPMYKNGATLVALDEITGQLKWAYGPMMASTEEEAMMRFESAPTGGPETVYAGYVLDNTSPGLHLESEYGIIAFESQTGRILWRKPICRQRPGKFASLDFTRGIRKRIRSFMSPPLYHQGTVYYCTNAGAVAALDALSGRVKWLTNYPYWSYPGDIHDATRGWGNVSWSDGKRIHPAGSGLWMNQAPLIVGDALYVLAVDSKFLFKMDRRNGKILWTRVRPDFEISRGGGRLVHFMGPIQTGELLFVFSNRGSKGGICLVDPETGKTVWWSKDPVPRETKHPCIYLKSTYNHQVGVGFEPWTATLALNGKPYQVTARPFLTQDGKLYVGSVAVGKRPVYGEASNLAVLDLKTRTLQDKRRRYLSGEMIRNCRNMIGLAPGMIKKLEALPKHVYRAEKKKNDYLMKCAKLLENDTVPINKHEAFLPFSRITFERYGTLFELRTSPVRMWMVYDRAVVKRAIAGKKDPESIFATAELAIGDGDLDGAVQRMESCLAQMSPEDVDFRAVVNQQLYRAYRELARGSIRKQDSKTEIARVMGMSQSSTTLADEIQTLFALADAYRRTGKFDEAAKYLRALVSRYGPYEHAVPSLYTTDRARVLERLEDVTKRTGLLVEGVRHEPLITKAMDRMRKTLPLYYSAISPARGNLSVRSEETAVAKLLEMQAESAAFRAASERQAAAALNGKPAVEQLTRLPEFPGTKAGQSAVERLLADSARQLAAAGDDTATAAQMRTRLWRVADTARLGAFQVPEAFQKQLLAPSERPVAPLGFPLREQSIDLKDERGTAWIVLARAGQRHVRPELLFLGGRVRKRLDNKFLLHAVDARTGQIVWRATEREKGGLDELRLKGAGNEPGFTRAFVHRDLVVVHGRFDVLAFRLADGTLAWRYRVPFDFDIRYSLLTGDLLMLPGENDTIVLYVPTKDPAGEVVWQEGETGDLYAEPWFHDDRFVSVRMKPFNITVRYRGTGRLIGRLDLDDLTLRAEHPIVGDGPRELPVARDGKLLALCGGGYYFLIDVERMKILWKRLMDIDANTPVRLELDGEYLAVIKRDFDLKSVYMLSSTTGKRLWKTMPDKPDSPQAIYSMLIRDGKLYGILPYAGRGFRFVGVDCKTGKYLFKPNTQKHYNSTPSVRLRRGVYGNTLVLEIRDRQDFELAAFDATTGKLAHRVKVKGVGEFGQHGRASATVQNGRMVLHGTNTVVIARPE